MNETPCSWIAQLEEPFAICSDMFIFVWVRITSDYTYLYDRNQNTVYVESNVINIHAKYQLHPPYGFWEEYFSPKIHPFCRPGN